MPFKSECSWCCTHGWYDSPETKKVVKRKLIKAKKGFFKGEGKGFVSTIEKWVDHPEGCIVTGGLPTLGLRWNVVAKEKENAI